MHALDSYHKNSDAFGNGDVPFAFDWPKPKWLIGRPVVLSDPRPLRTRYYYKYQRDINKKVRWIPTYEDALTMEEGLQLITRAVGISVVEISVDEYRTLKQTLRNSKITDYES